MLRKEESTTYCSKIIERIKIRKYSNVSDKNAVSDLAVASAVSFDADLRELIDAWPQLSDNQKTMIRNIISFTVQSCLFVSKSFC